MTFDQHGQQQHDDGTSAAYKNLLQALDPGVDALGFFLNPLVPDGTDVYVGINFVIDFG